MALQSVRPFEEPDVALEQYMTPAVIAADILFEAHRRGDIAGLKVVDLGCGTGMLSIGSWLLDAGMAIGFDSSEEALRIAGMNAGSLNAEVDFRLSDIRDVTEGADTVVMNPPFGCQRPHADRPFLEKALELSECVYSIHMAESLGFVESFAEKRGRNVDWRRNYGFDIPHMFPFHRKAKQTVEVVAVRIVRGRTPLFIGWSRNRTRSMRTYGGLPVVRRSETGGSHEFRFRYARRRGRRRGGVRRRRGHVLRERHRLRVPDGHAGAR